MSHLLLLEDDQTLAKSLVKGFEGSGYKVCHEVNTAGAKKALEIHKFNLGVLDLNLPDGNGFDILELMSGTPVIIMTALNSPENRLKGMELGNSDFIPKPFFFRELELKVEALLGASSQSKKILVGEVVVDLRSREVITEGDSVFLSDREYRLLNLLIEKSPEAVSRDDVLDIIARNGEEPTQRVVDNSILKLRNLLNDKDHHIIRTVRGVGYQWVHKGKDNG